jgi:hypothetical protein
MSWGCFAQWAKWCVYPLPATLSIYRSVTWRHIKRSKFNCRTMPLAQRWAWLLSLTAQRSTLTSVGWARLGWTFCRPPWHTGRTQLIVPALLAMPGTVVMVVYSLSCPTTMVMLAPTLSLTSVAHRISTLTSVGWARLGWTFCRPPWHTECTQFIVPALPDSNTWWTKRII